MRGIADGVHINIYAVQRLSFNGDAIVLPFDMAAHLLEGIDEGDISLECVFVESGDSDGSGGDSGGGEEVAGGGGIRFDVVLSGLKWNRVDDELGEVIWGVEVGTEVSHHLEGHLDIGFGDEFADDCQLYGRGAGWCGHEESAEELATDTSLDGGGATAEGMLSAMNCEWWAPGSGSIAGDICAELLKGINEVCDGALSHSFDAIESVSAVPEGTECGEEADAGSAVFEPEFSGVGRDVSGESFDGAVAVGNVLLDIKAESAETFDHHPCILAVEDAGECGGAICEGGEYESAVGDAFGAWWADGTAEGVIDWRDGDLLHVKVRKQKRPGDPFGGEPGRVRERLSEISIIRLLWRRSSSSCGGVVCRLFR